MKQPRIGAAAVTFTVAEVSRRDTGYLVDYATVCCVVSFCLHCSWPGAICAHLLPIQGEAVTGWDCMQLAPEPA